ncbi:hypothetical protein PAAG_06078 [Paracoccidioides lutzii Pb01]|uniref:Presequence translocated-associated motor subunit PAM17 n=1 Tax=Paracoccidioides lutzii (strain ATCC MYA-826 / Pb01) TaxID=502779 RepID=C1H5W8_PARBA|nr:hypothetical protein PAAG_06078 [Paracoccidioides lutzii Pb01]EEH35031.2 hypothetical protein PAAG_06078 [Paracoccidioides lutzii Pb01]
MSLTVMNGSLRTAVLASRIPCTFSPLILSNAANTAPGSSLHFPARHQQCKYSTSSFPSAQPQYHQKRQMSTRPSDQSLLKFQQSQVSRNLDQPTSSRFPPSAAVPNTTPLRSARKASTQASPSPVRSPDTPSTPGYTSSESMPLDWNSFFRLRASRRKYSLISSIIASVCSTAGGVQVLVANNIDTTGAQALGLDPFIVLGLATASCAALGWLLGPVLGNSLWGLVHRKNKAAVAVKEKEFYSPDKAFPAWIHLAIRIPTQSLTYYGERIGQHPGDTVNGHYHGQTDFTCAL